MISTVDIVVGAIICLSSSMPQIRTTTIYCRVRPAFRGIFEPIKTVDTEAHGNLVLKTNATFLVTI